jgi:hypothetical protein
MKPMGMMALLAVCVLMASQAPAQYYDYGQPLAITRSFTEMPIPLFTYEVGVDTPPTEEKIQEWMDFDLATHQMRPFWSPTGECIAFQSSNPFCLWIVPVEGGVPERVYGDMYQSVQNYMIPSMNAAIRGFSQDGSEVFFTDWDPFVYFDHPDNFVTITRNGTSFRTESNYRVAKRSLKAVNIHTGAVRIVRPHVANAIFSPDGRYAFMDLQEFDFEKDDYDDWSILVNLETGEERDIDFRCMRGCFTPDGNTIIVNYDGSLYMAPVTDPDATVLLADCHANSHSRLTCTSDGNWVVFHRSILFSETLGADKLQACNIMTGEITSLSNIDDLLGSRHISISPAGDRYVYEYRNRHPDANKYIYAQVYVADMPFELRYVPLAVETETPTALSITGNYPNPFNPTTTISFTLAEPGHTGFVVFNLAGQQVRSLTDAAYPAGAHEVVWDGCDDTGMRVSSGVYIARLTNGTYTASHRMTLVK